MEINYDLALTYLPNVGPVNAKTLVSYAGSAKEVLTMPLYKLIKIPGIGTITANAIHAHKADALKQADAELSKIENKGITVLGYTSAAYPKRLKQCADAPMVLFEKGSVDWQNFKTIGIVGTRMATDYGKGMVKEILADFKHLNIIVVSGLAYGIDIAAHKEAVHLGIPTVGVLGHGLHTIYPALHKSTADAMLSNGALLTEFGYNTAFTKENFPKRNRIIAGLCDCLLVVEASEKGGALITAHLANGYNRDVFAVPGRSSDVFSVGCNNIIKQNIAVMATSAADIISAMGWQIEPLSTKKKNVQPMLLLNLTADEQLIVDILKVANCAIDDIMAKTEWPYSRISTTLLTMEMSNIIQTLPGKMYRLVS